MGSHNLLVWLWILVLVFSCSFVSVSSSRVVEGTVFIHGKNSIAETDEDFICATLDWWPPQKCDYGTCSWDHTSIINLDLNNTILLNAVKAFSPLKIRIGGTLQDKVIYDTEDNKLPCYQFVKSTSALLGFTRGCLSMHRWDELNVFFKKSGAKIIFGLNALMGKYIRRDGSTFGAWNYSNAQSFISYTVRKGYSIHGWELGNEVSGNGYGARIAADQYASDTISLDRIVKTIYNGIEPKPIILGPGGFFEANWYREYLVKAGTSLDVATHHIYNLGPGVDQHLVEKILDPLYLDGVAITFFRLKNTLWSSGTSATAWVGEAGGAYNSGRNLVSNAFVYSFWYLDQLGMSSVFNTKTYCRQSLIGGNYGLLNTRTFEPNPDYYSALLWHRLMGRRVLSTRFIGTKKIRAYTHCAKQSKGITLLLINLDISSTVHVHVKFSSTSTLHHKHEFHRTHSYNEMDVIELPEVSATSTTREEYHLTAKDGNLHSRTMLLNGNALTINPSGDIQSLEPVLVNPSTPITVAPLSIVFVQMPYLLPACR